MGLGTNVNFQANSMRSIAGAVLLMAASGSSAYTVPSIPAACAGAGSATCKTITASGIATNSDSIAAQAVFELDGSTLFVTLSNTSLADVTSNPSVLTALMFNLKYTNGDAVTLNPVNALINTISGSSVAFDADTIYDAGGPNNLESTCAGTVSGTATCNAAGNDVGGEWEYNNTINYKGFTQGISSSGLGLFGAGTMFGATNLSGPPDVDGPQYGITTQSDTKTTGNLNGPLTQDTVQFKLNITNLAGHAPLALNTPGALSAGFQYGTNLNDTFLPIPGTLPLLAFGLLFLGWSVRRQAARS
jgi:hypothetical protein